ncbi:hypothetical protein [Phaeocystidibacter luteus]|uniref:Glycosyltransferase family 4 protein n=1 Tax=Phaeocystidibacter luteus TaxID=911197 RepID=A0A6N6RJ15_9FLAO|nr:hypothetical protein [Phaeocystidibacter luteus]KAB2814330.1 hypothetical protein F8C67_00945 [Phaeocystidibacter luteus]
MKLKGIKRSNLVLFDPFRSEVLKDLLLQDAEYFELNTRFSESESSLYVSPKSWVSFIWTLLFKTSSVPGFSLKHRVLLAYYSSILSASGASRVVSLYGATNRFFAALSKLHPRVKFDAFVTYQLHDRFLEDIKSSEAHFYVMGEFDKSQLLKVGIAEAKVSVIGSIHFNAFTRSSYFQKSAKQKYDLVLISQYQHFWEENTCTDIRRVAERIFTQMVDYLNTYLSSHEGLKLAVALRPQPTPEATELEKEYFKAHLNGSYSIEYVSNVPGEFTSYQTIMNSTAVVSHYSTIAFEALAVHKPVVFCQFYDYSAKFRIPSDLPFVIREPNYAQFESAISSVLSPKMNGEFDFDALSRRYNSLPGDEGMDELAKKLSR